MLNRLFPRQADNRFEGHRAALWLLGLGLVLSLIPARSVRPQPRPDMEKA